MDDDELRRVLGASLGNQEDAPLDHLAVLMRAWVNETAAPEVLPFLEESVTQLSDLITTTQRTIEENATRNVSYAFMGHLYQMDLERAKFVLRGYLNARLRKIETFAPHILMAQETRDCLSQAELTFATKFRAMTNQLFMESVVKELPESIRGLDDVDNEQHKMILEPDLRKHVLCRVCAPDGCSIEFSDSSTVEDFKFGSIIAIPYYDVRDFVRDGSVELL